MRGIILAGGVGSRLYPATAVVSKQLLPVFDKPMVYYPLALLLDAGVREILVITTPRDRAAFATLLGDGSRFGASISYATQALPRGIPEALVIGRTFTKNDRVALLLGDNVFYGDEVIAALASAATGKGTHIFAYRVKTPEQYGVVEFDDAGRAASIAEKPLDGRSPWAIPGVYVFPARAWSDVTPLRKSPRGELEITDLLRKFARRRSLTVHKLGKRTTWMDTGTPRALRDATVFVGTMQTRRSVPIGSPEFSAVRGGLVRRDTMLKRLRAQRSEYAQMIVTALECL